MFLSGLFVAILASWSAFLGYQQHEQTPTNDHAPWIETPAGYPVIQTDPWRIRVCHIHHKLIKRSPYSPPMPLHHVLGLDPTSKPFYPPKLSDDHWDPLYDEVHAAITIATSRGISAKMQQMAVGINDLEEDHMDPDRDWVDIVTSIASLLSDDQIRGHYAHWFVPALTGGRILGDKWKPDKMIREARTRALEKLCA
ncbi:hypothetical protein NM208_g3123 [Fusarium decemcellulare]|uniref:Uncharacterized protein n=1 Tax=Fusarium decemcellulare TaxID=57161 RepID=A0ACC1SQL1_9HYPO|nr:hypothetical protein NM208_g3123 [Fusarium decemcellulare]